MEPNLDSEVNPRFGRSRYFILIDPETMEFESIINPNIEASGGAGIGTAQLVYSEGASVVITGTIGPKAHQALDATGVRMITGVSGSIRDAVAGFKAGRLSGEAGPERDATAGGGASMGRGMGGGGKGGGKGGGMGRGMGMGMGRGMGRGMGCGGGRGMGMGAGRGGGLGRAAPQDRDVAQWPDSMPQTDDRDELSLLRQQAEQLAGELDGVRRRIEQIEKK